MFTPLCTNYTPGSSTPPLGTHSTGLLLHAVQTGMAALLFDVVPTYSF